MVEPSPNEIASLNLAFQRLSKLFQDRLYDIRCDFADAKWQAAA